MAYDGYQYPNSGYQANMNPENDPPAYSAAPPYPSYYEQEHITMPQPHAQVPPTASPAPPPAPTSNYEPYPEPARPQNTYSGFNDAVSSAVYQNANVNANASYLSPEVLSQITSTVIQQLKASGLNDLQGSPQNPQHQYPPPPTSRPQSQAPQPTWPAPPSELPQRPQTDSPPALRRGSIPRSEGIPNGLDTAAPYPDHLGHSGESRSSFKPSQESSSRRTGSMSSQGSLKTESRPKPPDRDMTVMEMTTLEKIWGKLFEDDQPTKRLGQFLRGIAMHLIEDYPPGNTLVITPEKLQKFYAETSVERDPYPWHDIFDDRTSSISRLFREVKAQHHLVQSDDLKERPDTPGLTPKGFETWATLLIQGNPDREYERFQKAVLNMPISNPDDKKERFPKEIPRRLFPEYADIKLREDVEEHLMKHCGVDLPYITEEERAKAANRPKKTSPVSVSSSSESPKMNTGASTTERSRSYERGRPPPAHSSSAVIDDEDETIPPAPIERERKPYSANPGGGKVYDDGASSSARSHRDSVNTSRPRRLSPSAPTPTSTHRVSVSTKPRSPPREPMYARSGSGPAPARRFSRSSRSSSRGVNHEYRHSESDLLGRDHTPRYGAASSNDLYMESPSSMGPTESDTRRHHASHRNSRPEEEYYRGMLGGQGGGPTHEYKYYH